MDQTRSEDNRSDLRLRQFFHNGNTCFVNSNVSQETLQSTPGEL